MAMRGSEMGSRRALQRAIHDFSSSLRTLVTTVSDSVGQLQRASDLPPSTSGEDEVFVAEAPLAVAPGLECCSASCWPR